MKLNKTKLAGIISLLCCTTTMAAVNVTVVSTQTDDSRFGPFVSAASPDASQIATYTQTYAQSFTYDIGAPWTYNEYCLYDSDVCEMLWDGTKTEPNDSLIAWRSNILNTFANHHSTYKSETSTKIGGADVTGPGQLKFSTKITAVSDAGNKVGYATGEEISIGDRKENITRRGFFNGVELLPTFTDNEGFSAAHDFADVEVSNSNGSTAYSYKETLAVGQASVNWANTDDTGRFTGCFDYFSYDSRYDYDDIYLCPGFDLQASYWKSDGTGIGYFSNNSETTWLSTGGDATFIANAYAINTSGFAVGFSTKQIYSSSNGGRARAAIFKPTVTADDTISYKMSEIRQPTEDTGSDYNDVIRDTVAVDITDKKYDSATKTFVDADGTDAEQAFIVVGNRTFNQPKNRSYATEFFTYNVADGSVRYPLTDTPVKGANSRVTKINNDGIAVGWRDSRGEVNPTYQGSPRFQSAFLYDFKKDKSVYLDDMYCFNKQPEDITIRITNAISISEKVGEFYTILANGYDYETSENYKNKTGSKPVVVKMTFEADDIDNIGVCPTAENEPYERQGAGMGWFLLLPLTILFRRRFNG